MSDLLLYGEVTSDTGTKKTVINAKSVVAEIDALVGKRIKIRLNTPGGSVYDGHSIAQSIRAHGNVHTHVDALAASMGATIFLAGSYRTVSVGSRIMIHNPACLVFGDAKAMRKEAGVLEGFEVDFAKMYSEVSGGRITREEAQQLMDEETWFTPEQAVAVGFAHAIIGNPTAYAQIPAAMQFKNTPKGMYTMSEETAKPKQSLLDTLMARFTVDTSAVTAQLDEAVAALGDASAKLVNAEARIASAEARASEAVAALATAQEAHAVALAEAVAAARIEGAQEFAVQNLKASAPEALPHVEENVEAFSTHSAKWDALYASGDYKAAGEYYSKHKNLILEGK